MKWACPLRANYSQRTKFVSVVVMLYMNKNFEYIELQWRRMSVMASQRYATQLFVQKIIRLTTNNSSLMVLWGESASELDYPHKELLIGKAFFMTFRPDG